MFCFDVNKYHFANNDMRYRLLYAIDVAYIGCEQKLVLLFCDTPKGDKMMLFSHKHIKGDRLIPVTFL